MWSLFQITADNLFINIFITEPMQQILKFFKIKIDTVFVPYYLVVFISFLFVQKQFRIDQQNFLYST